MPRLFVVLIPLLLTGLVTARAAEPPASAKDAEPWWSLKPIVKAAPPAVPSGKFADWPRTPIDRFILAKLLEKGLEPAPAADKRTLLRRVTFDLTGLPPTPEETDAFLADTSSDAYEKVVERLLASPAHGERWARHWMDVAHYAETHGHDQDRPRPNAWPYRDYLIRSFNSDKSYARFAQEQIAGDVLFPNDPDAVVAMGFLATGPWDESSLRDIREDTIDRQIARYLDRDDMVTTAMSTFVSTTVHCARCHDHKFDPIAQKEYYGLQAVFAGVDKAERAYDADPGLTAKRKQLADDKTRLSALRGSTDASLLTPAVQAEVAAWEKKVGAGVIHWTVLDPATMKSANGATLTKLPDNSVLSTGKRPETDITSLSAHTDLQAITGVRVEVLTDDSLPHRGPGRKDNGNLHLNEFQVRAAPRSNINESKQVLLKNPAADFNQDGWTVGMAIDGNPKTAWGIYPKVGQPHRAVFEFEQPVGFRDGTTFIFVFEQTHGGDHLLRRVRVSVTTALQPLTAAEALPETLTAILALPAGQRTDKQRAELALHVLEQKLDRAITALPPQQLVYSATGDFKPDGSFKPAGKPRPVHILKRGDINKPGTEAKPGALECVPGLEAHFRLTDSDNEGSRRVALARWVSDPKNVLTWRSIVNRLWHFHFGRGIVDTPGDFGHMGAKPTHSELLDWLAAEFLEQGGSLKHLHRLIVTSAAYRQSSRHEPRFAEIDNDNHYLWRANRTRLDAEEVRDAVLVAAGRLDRTMGGASVKQFNMSPGIHVTPNVDYQGFEVDRPEMGRRAVYRFVFRTLPDPFLEALDCPDSSQLTQSRTVSVTAPQALALMNDRFMVRMSEHLAARAEKAGADLPAQVGAAYRFALGREPTTKEAALLAEYAKKHGLANLCRMVLNCNEFVFVN
jgi:Protein of unknown function (DUF1553)/Protein of unknown function (DUF1549)